MFTGLIETTARVASRDSESLTIDLSAFDEGIEVGSSVAIDGVCLTVAGNVSNRCRFDVSKETQTKTTLSLLREGDKVNVERAMTLSDRLGGHFVTGHIDDVAVIEKISPDAITVTMPEQLMKKVAEKGSIAIDGISLTVAAVTDRGFSAALVPHTFKETNLNAKKPGSKVNVETDIIAKYVARLLNQQPSGVTLDKLRDHGFV